MKKIWIAFATTFFLFCVSAFADSKNLVFNESYDYKGIDSITISLSYESLKISQIYGDEIVVEIGSNNIKKIPEVSIVQDELLSALEIKTTIKKATRGTNCTVYLYLPQDFLADRIDISLVSGNLQAENLRSQNAWWRAVVRHQEGRPTEHHLRLPRLRPCNGLLSGLLHQGLSCPDPTP